jgi:hypothetical protein
MPARIVHSVELGLPFFGSSLYFATTAPAMASARRRSSSLSMIL